MNFVPDSETMWSILMGWIKGGCNPSLGSLGQNSPPKGLVGWGIKAFPFFASSLAVQSGWCILSIDNLSTVVVKMKYINLVPIDEWMHRMDKKTQNASVIWKVIVESFRIIEDGLA